ncbi:hypothetical protein [Roseimarinus sediminis]|uniref:hypothetical protein n=1 Tax=Roseimarinus sediminis TaxID=1610899 RepID=UPI003D1F88B3
MNINAYIEQFTRLWEQADPAFPAGETPVPFDEKIKREQTLIGFSEKLKNESEFSSAALRKQKNNRLNRGIEEFFRKIMNFTEGEAAVISGMAGSGVSKKFMQMAREFDPEVSMDDVFQASRNLWIINSLQIMMGEPIRVTPSVFAYSMLYPYSDNYLDDPDVDTIQKIEFSKRFRLRLSGEKVLAVNRNEQLIFDLVYLIESDWDRNKFPGVYQSLLAIHDAQTRSIRLLNERSQLSDAGLLSICIDKGGTSVLADAYLMKGLLTEAEERFCFGFGTFLQFVDDIQDLHEDLNGALETAFTRAANHGQLEEFVNRTISFSRTVMNNMDCFTAPNLHHMQQVMIKSVNFLLTEAIALNERFFDIEYVQQMELASPFRYEFVRQRRNKMASNRISLMKKIESMVMETQEVAI